jgi:hypothetical protein
MSYVDFDPLEEWPFKDEDRHFVSGVNHPGEVRGLVLSARNVGITCSEIRGGLLQELEQHAGPGHLTDVFVDSGAFGEVEFGPKGRTVVAPITDDDWRERLAVYRRVAYAFGRHAFLVLPDSVGDQKETLARLHRYRDVAHELHRLGAHLILPVQRGELDGAEFVEAALEAVGLQLDEQLILGIPSKKAATTPDELGALCRRLWHLGADGLTFHLLGMGPRSPGWGPMREAIRDWFTDAAIYSDSVDLRREVGRTNGRGGTARRLTEAQDRARAKGLDAYETKAQALIECGVDDMRRASQAARRAGWYDPELESAPGVPFINEDTGKPCLNYGPGGPFGIGGGLQATLDLGDE